MKDIFKENLDESLMACIGKTSDQMTTYELKKWAKEHKDEWRVWQVLAATGGASEAEIRAQLVANAYTRVGDIYSRDKRREPGYADCSSLIQWIYEETIPQAKKDGSFWTTSGGQGVFCERAGVTFHSSSAAEPGDLIFWALKNDESFRPDQDHISHVGMVMENGSGGIKVIEATPSKGCVYVFNRIRNKDLIVYFAKPVLLYTGEVIFAVPDEVKTQDMYGVVSTSEYVEDKHLDEGDRYVYYYCSCSLCREKPVCDMTGEKREVGIMAISAADQISYAGAKDTQQTVGDETGTIMSVDGTIYKCRDYSEGRFALDLDTVGIYTDDTVNCYSCKLIWSDGATRDGIAPGETFINDHLAAVNRTYEHQITTSASTYAVRSIDPEGLLPESVVVYRNSGNTANEYVAVGG